MRLVGQPLAAPPSRALSVPAEYCHMVGLAQEGRGADQVHQPMVQVNSTTLEHVLEADEGVHITLIKIDVEGAELSVLHSLLPTLARVENIVVETSPGWWTSRYNQSRAAGAERLADGAGARYRDFQLRLRPVPTEQQDHKFAELRV